MVWLDLQECILSGDASNKEDLIKNWCSINLKMYLCKAEQFIFQIKTMQWVNPFPIGNSQKLFNQSDDFKMFR